MLYYIVSYILVNAIANVVQKIHNEHPVRILEEEVASPIKGFG